jgi:hypothetical protein
MKLCVTEGRIMKPNQLTRPRDMKMALAVCFILTPPILLLGSILWLFMGEWFPQRLTQVIASFTGWW